MGGSALDPLVAGVAPVVSGVNRRFTPDPTEMLLGLDLYRQGHLWASGLTSVVLGPGTQPSYSVNLGPVQGHGGALYRILLNGPWESAHEGWLTGRAQLVVNVDYSHELPLTFWTGAATDVATGIVRFDLPDPYVGWPDRPPRVPEHPHPRILWMLGVRRFR